MSQTTNSFAFSDKNINSSNTKINVFGNRDQTVKETAGINMSSPCTKLMAPPPIGWTPNKGGATGGIKFNPIMG